MLLQVIYDIFIFWLNLVDGLCCSWGDNKYGQLGIGNTTKSNIPQLIKFPQNEKIIQIQAKSCFSIAITCNLFILLFILNWKMTLNALLGDIAIMENLVMFKKPTN